MILHPILFVPLALILFSSLYLCSDISKTKKFYFHLNILIGLLGYIIVLYFDPLRPVDVSGPMFIVPFAESSFALTLIQIFGPLLLIVITSVPAQEKIDFLAKALIIPSLLSLATMISIAFYIGLIRSHESDLETQAFNRASSAEITEEEIFKIIETEPLIDEKQGATPLTNIAINPIISQTTKDRITKRIVEKQEIYLAVYFVQNKQLTDKDRQKILSSIKNPDDNERLKRIINHPIR